MSYLPYAFWGADSKSNYSFAHILIYHGGISLGGKRRFLYPILMLPISLLPGGALRWLPLFQHTLGVASLLPLAYAVRKTLRSWRVWIVPITVIYAGHPTVLWCEHELLGDTVLFATFAWAFAGWLAWVGQEKVERSRRMFWWFLVPFALFILTKPAGRFVWPGIIAGLVIAGGWRLLSRGHAIALLAVLLITPAVGSSKQGIWLVYSAVFPLTRLETPLHAEYKAEVKDLVQKMRDNLEVYYALENIPGAKNWEMVPYLFLRDPDLQTARPHWTPLGQKENEKLRNKIYMDLALEAMKGRPDLVLYLSLQRLVGTAACLQEGNTRFADGALSSKFAEFYNDAAANDDSPVRLALALPRRGPIPPYEEYRRNLEPAPGSWPARVVQACADAYGGRLNLVRFPELPVEQRKFSLARPTYLGWWLIAGALLSLLPRYLRTLGVWTLISVGYLVGVFIVGVVDSHYFVPVWPVLLPLLAIPAEVIWALAAGRGAKPGI